ncbi:MAG: M1 family metallopeptidase [Anaerolineae bacterium]|nr:M1 family metallopeptidase [Anaerolineae bacterium]NUQ02663.1 M1 family metallopeptidase [Anaerolineae bacterium]
MLTLQNTRWFLLSVFVLAACSLGRPDETAPPTSTVFRLAQASLAAAPTRGFQAAPSRIPEPTPTLADADCIPGGEAPTAAHVIEAEVNYARRTVDVQHVIRMVNRTSDAFEQILLNIEPNRLPAAFTLVAASANQPLEMVEVIGRRMTLNLVEPLLPGCDIEIALSYSLTLPQISSGISGLIGYFGYSNRQLNLGHWLATPAVYRDGGWVTHDVTVIGEQLVSDIADWDVTLTVSDPPDNLVMAGPGTVTQEEDGRWRVLLEASRDFVVSFSPFFRRTATFTEQGVEVEIFTFDNAVVNTPAGPVDGAQQALEAAIQSLTMYADLYGEMSRNRFVIVQGDFPDGMEFTQMVFVSDQWFRTNPGTAESYLTIITVHEAAHQWWYARVGNDQALTPWLDEALATYSEYVFYEEFHPDLKEWWWNYRVASFVPPSYIGKRVDSTVYEFATVREYINAVYLRGALMLHECREALGTDAFFDWLRRYSEVGANRIVDADQFWMLLTDEQMELIRPIRQAFFNPLGG